MTLIKAILYPFFYVEWLLLFRRSARAVDSQALGPFAFRMANKDGLKRFFDRTFEAGSQFPTVKDLAVSLGFEFRYLNITLSDALIVPWAERIQYLWRKSLGFQFHNRFKQKDELGGRLIWEMEKQHPKEFRKVMASLLRDPLSIQKKYFESYNTLGGTDQVVVFLPAGEASPNYKDPYRVEVRAKRDKGTEKGFYRLGFEYGLNIKNRIHSLQEAHRGYNGREFGYFGFEDARPPKAKQRDLLWVH